MTRPGRAAVVMAVMRKELVDLVRNRTLLVSLIAPVILAILFVQVVEHAQSTAMVKLAMLRGSDERVHTALSLVRAFDVRDVEAVADAREGVENGTVDAALLLPPDFDASLRAGSAPAVTLVVRRDAGPRTAASVAALTELLRLRAGQQSPVALSMDTVGRDERSIVRGRLVVGFVVFVLLMGFGLVATSLVEERERGTMQAIRVTGASPAAVLSGKALITWLLCLAAALTIIGMTGLLRPPLAGLLTVMAVGCGFGVALGLLAGVLFPNMAAANAGLPVIFMVLFIPAMLEDRAAWAAWMPGYWLMQGLQRTLVDARGIEAVWGATLVLGACAVAAAAAAWQVLGKARDGS